VNHRLISGTETVFDIKVSKTGVNQYIRVHNLKKLTFSSTTVLEFSIRRGNKFGIRLLEAMHEKLKA
jgi:hypothetical protein